MQIHGHDKQLKLFEDLFKSGGLSGAWLLVGPKGVGKATFAHCFAQKVFGKTAEQLESHGSFRVLERELTDEEKKKRQALIDAGKELNPKDEAQRKRKASISIDDVRKVISFTGLKALMSEPKIVLIDSINEMQAEAANALLKTLEEPPDATIFLLVCHNEHGVLETIRSRCKKVHFNRIDKGIMEKEIGDPLLVELADGCMGTALKMKNQTELIYAFTDELKKKDKKGMAAVIDKLMKEEEGEEQVKMLIVNEIHKQGLQKRGAYLDLYAETEKLFQRSERLYLDTKKVFLTQIVKLWGLENAH